MTQQSHRADNDQPFDQANPVSDPITGSRILAEKRDFETGKTSGHTWGIAARWIAFAFLLVLAVLLLYWMAGDRMQ